MASNINAPLSRDQIKIGYIDSILGFVDGITICDANAYAQKNPGTTFILTVNRSTIKFLNINQINKLNTQILTTDIDSCPGIQTYKECGPPKIQFFGGGGIAAAGNPIIGSDGAILGVDLVSGGYGYQFEPLVSVKDDCYYGSGGKLIAVLGNTVDEYEVFTDEEDFEEYEICVDTEESFGTVWGPNGEEIGPWNPNQYTNAYEDPIRKEIEKYQKFLLTENNPFFTTRKNKPFLITSSRGDTLSTKYDISNCPVRKPDGSSAWGSFIESYAISPVPPSDVPGSDFADVTFNFEYVVEFPFDGDYTFSGSSDNVGKLYVDGDLIANLGGFTGSPTTVLKSYKKGNHSVKLELLNKPITVNEVIKIFDTADWLSSSQTGRNANIIYEGPLLSSYAAGTLGPFLTPRFTSDEDYRANNMDKTWNLRWKNVNFPANGVYELKAEADDYVIVKVDGKEVGKAKVFDGVKTFTFEMTQGNKTIDMEIYNIPGNSTSTFKTNPVVFNATIMRKNVSGITTTVTASWNQNPMAIALAIQSPPPPVPKEPLPVQEGPCPPSPIWTTRFPGSAQLWNPVIFTRRNSWSKFTNRYAISPVPPLDTPGSDNAGTTYINTWNLEIPYDGFYGFKGTADNKGAIFIDGEKVTDLDGFKTENPKLIKKFVRKGNREIKVEVYNQPVTVTATTNINQKVFSTKDWLFKPSPPLVPNQKPFKVTAAYTGVKNVPTNFKAGIYKISANYRQELRPSGIAIEIKNKLTGNVVFNTLQNISNSNVKLLPISSAEFTVEEFTLNSEESQEFLLKSGVFPENVRDRSNTNIEWSNIYIGEDGDYEITASADDQITFEISIVSGLNSNNSSAVINQSPAAVGVVYEGPTPIANYRGDFISPVLQDVNATPNEEVQGKRWIFRWSSVNFPVDGQYFLESEADDELIVKIDGVTVGTSRVFEGRKKTVFNVTKGLKVVELQLSNIRIPNTGFQQNPVVGFAEITTPISLTSSSISAKPWTQNPMGVSAVIIPPPCRRKRSGRGVVVDVIVEDPGNGYLSPAPDPNNYPVILRLKEVIVKNSGINYNCGVDQITITPNNGVELDYTCDSFGRINSVNVINKGTGFTSYPLITMPSDTGVNVEFAPIFEIVRDPIEAPADQIIQVTDLVGLKQTGYIEGRAYYGAVFYKDGIKFAGYYETPGRQVQVYDTLQESIEGRVTTPASAIPRVGTDVSSNNPQLNIPGTPNTISET